MSAAAKLDDFTGRLEELQDLRAQVKAHKERAASHSEDLMRSRMELGAAQKQLEQIPALSSEIALLKEKNEELSFKLQESHRALEAAEAAGAKNAAKVEAFDRFSEVFRVVTAPE